MDGLTAIPAADPRISYSDYQNRIDNGGRIGFNRTVPNEKKYNLDSPGARMRFRTNASKIIVDLLYKERTNPNRMQNGLGVYLVDGKAGERTTFERSKRDGCKNEPVAVKIRADGEWHDYELVLPYGDIVEIHTLHTNPEAEFAEPKPRPPYRAVFFGDSIVHGFSASRIDRTFPYLVGELLDWEIVNMGIAGIGLNPGAAKVLGALKMNRLVCSIGANDWREGMLPEKFRANLEKFLHDFRAFQPKTPVDFLSPMWLSTKFKAPAAHHTLQEFREVYAEFGAECGDPHVRIINGSELIDHDPALYEPDHVHPRDAGIEQLAERLAEQLMEDL